MNQNQTNRKQMVEATLLFLDENSSLWQSIAKIGAVKNQLSAINLSIDENAESQEEYRAGVGKQKLMVKRSLCNKADIVNDLVEVYATMEGEKELAAQMNDSATQLYRLKNSDCARRVKLIITKATENKEILIAEYGLTEEMLTDLQAEYDLFMELDGKPREYQIKKGMATLQLDELFSQASDLLNNQLDNLMKIFKRRDPNFYNGYLKARMVIDN